MPRRRRRSFFFPRSCRPAVCHAPAVIDRENDVENQREMADLGFDSARRHKKNNNDNRRWLEFGVGAAMAGGRCKDISIGMAVDVDVEGLAT